MHRSTFFLLLLTATSALRGQDRPTYAAVVRGMECRQSSVPTAVVTAQLDCEYRVGEALVFVIAGVGRPDPAITVVRAAGYDADYYATIGLRHGCVIVKPGKLAIEAAINSPVRPDMAFVSPYTGNVYATWQDCEDSP